MVPRLLLALACLAVAGCTIEIIEQDPLLESGCGNGEVDPGEACDTGGPTATCDVDCTLPLCGDLLANSAAGEACDDGNAFNGDGCSAACLAEGLPPPACGDGQVQPSLGEVCDDGNLESGDGCRADCRSLEVCGNGVVDAGEQCDDGNLDNGDGCRSDCTIELCGDGIVDLDEQCDDGNVASGDGCSQACTLE